MTKKNTGAARTCKEVSVRRFLRFDLILQGDGDVFLGYHVCKDTRTPFAV